VVQRTAELMRAHGDDGVEREGGIPLGILQKYINQWFTLSLDLFGGELSSNAATYFAAGLKGRYKEDRHDEHSALGQIYRLQKLEEGRVVELEVPLRNAMNEVLRDAYVQDNVKGVEYWNRVCERAGIDFRFSLPHRRFNRAIGEFAGHRFDLEGKPIDEATWNANVAQWLPTPEDRTFVKSLMKRVDEPGKMASWIAPPAKGISGKPLEYEYVRD
jgi:benzoyl-CoA 2,3-dioxygenase component B